MTAQDAGTRDTPQHDRSSSGWLGKRIGRRPARPQRQPGRVEGAEEFARGQPGQNGRPGGRDWTRFWWLLPVLFAANWITASVMLAPEARAPVSYTFFLDQVGALKVESITSTGESIEGIFRNPVSYVPPLRATARK